MSDRRRDEATSAARLKERDKEIMRLRRRLQIIADCLDRRCHLCLTCLAASQDEDA